MSGSDTPRIAPGSVVRMPGGQIGVVSSVYDCSPDGDPVVLEALVVGCDATGVPDDCVADPRDLVIDPSPEARTEAIRLGLLAGP